VASRPAARRGRQRCGGRRRRGWYAGRRRARDRATPTARPGSGRCPSRFAGAVVACRRAWKKEGGGGKQTARPHTRAGSSVASAAEMEKAADPDPRTRPASPCSPSPLLRPRLTSLPRPPSSMIASRPCPPSSMTAAAVRLPTADACRHCLPQLGPSIRSPAVFLPPPGTMCNFLPRLLWIQHALASPCAPHRPDAPLLRPPDTALARCSLACSGALRRSSRLLFLSTEK
jgi:hypothetical protein